MNTQGPSEHTCGHGRPLFEYEEGLLGETERAEIERVLAECPSCRAQLDELRRLKRLVKTAAGDAPCPDEWRLFEFICYGTDPGGRVKAHLTQCARCTETARVISSPVVVSIPPELLSKVEAKTSSSGIALETSPLGQAATIGDVRGAPAIRATPWERLSRFFRPPVWAASLAGAAAVVLFAVMYSGDIPQDVAVLSSVSWEGAPRPKGLQPADGRAAFIIVAGERGRPLDQRQADELYRSLAPTMELLERCRIIAPDKVSAALKKARPRPRSIKDALKRLVETAGVTEAVVINVQEGGGLPHAQVQLIDPATGDRIAERHVKGLSESAFPKAVKDAAFTLLEQRFPPPAPDNASQKE